MIRLSNKPSLYRNLGILGGILSLFLALGILSKGSAVDDTTSAISRPVEASAQKEAQTKEPYVYNPEGKLDPFRPFIDALASKQQQRPEVPLTPLQKFNINQLKLVGIIRGGSETKALIQDPSNKGYIVDVGTLIGPNWGRVVEITPAQVIVVEEHKDALGRVTKQKIIMNLHAAGEEEPG
jgi:type IV pilus assembly protein PilP